ncbi:MAG: hypothetical protein HY901_14600, partial [Deltaproteobacteria bacterium]|nr:hypothetical protein [Deltaproteobacteria bacterium]
MDTSSDSAQRMVTRRTALLLCLGSLVVGGGLGFLGGVLSVPAARSFFAGMFEDERQADVAHPKRFERPGFRFDYPGNWKIDREDSDFDPDHLVSVESPGASFAMVIVAAPELDPAAATRAQEEAFSKKLFRGQATRTPFQKWGRFQGEGVDLGGRILGLSPGAVRVFSFRAGEATFTV